jgi:hypothetical protein
MNAVFTASTAKIRRFLPHPSMHPIELYPGRSLVAFTAFEYRRTDLDAYNELGISILIGYGKRPRGLLSLLSLLRSRTFPAFVWKLPVTTEVARKAGVELYGYPKFLADIEFGRRESHIECTLSESGSEILRLRGRVLPVSAGPQLRYRTYSVKDGTPLCANVYTNPQRFAESLRRDAAELELGASHPIARDLRSIELGDRPLLYMYSPTNQAVLFGPRNLIDD